MIRSWVKEWWLLLVPALFAAGAVLAYTLTFHTQPATENPSAWGTFGDYIGGLLNPLISLFTLMVAMQVWKLQKTELIETQKALKEQAKTSEQQRQEQRFFDLLGLYQRTVDSITYLDRVSENVDAPVVQSAGKQALGNWLADRLPPQLAKFRRDGLNNKLYRTDPYSSDSTTYQITKESLTVEWNSNSASNQFDHYLRVIFRVLTESEALLCDQHYRYVKLFRAQLSRAELILIGFNLWLDEEGKGMAPLAAKYGLLKHLPKGHLRTQLEKELSPEVFGRKFAKSQASLNSSEAAPC